MFLALFPTVRGILIADYAVAPPTTPASAHDDDDYSCDSRSYYAVSTEDNEE